MCGFKLKNQLETNFLVVVVIIDYILVSISLNVCFFNIFQFVIQFDYVTYFLLNTFRICYI